MNIRTFATKHRWSLMVTGLVLMIAIVAIQSYSRTYFEDQANAIAAKSLKDIVRESFKVFYKVETAADGIVERISEQQDNPDEMFALSRQLVADNPEIKGCSISFEPYFFKDKGKYFSAYSYAGKDSIVSEQEGDDGYQYFCMDWYLIPKQLDKRYWIEPYAETSSDGIIVNDIMTSYSRPLYDRNDSLIGVLSADVPLSLLSDSILSHHPFEKSYCMLLGRSGTYIVHPDSTRLLYETILTPTLDGSHPQLMALGKAMIGGETGFRTLPVDGEDSHVFYMPFGRTGWSLALVCPDDVLLHNYHLLSALLMLLLLVAVIMTATPLWDKLHRQQHMTTACLLLGITVIVSCRQGQTTAVSKEYQGDTTKLYAAYSLMKDAFEIPGDRIFKVIDSLEQAGDICPSEANFERGDRYYDMQKLRTAILYFNKALETDELWQVDRNHYYNALNGLSLAQYNSDNISDCIVTTTRACELASKDTTMLGRDWVNHFLQRMGNCQMLLHHEAEATETYERAGRGAEQLALAYPDNEDCQESLLLITSNIMGVYTTADDYKNASIWFARMERGLQRYAATSAPMRHYERYWGMLMANKALLLAMSGRNEEAEIAFRDFLTTERANTDEAIYDKIAYWEQTKQWEKFLDVMHTLESLYTTDGPSNISLDYLMEVPSATFKALQKTGRKDEALQKAEEIINLLDTVKANQHRNDAEELAVIYETQKKEEQIAEQRASLAQQKYVTMGIVFALILVALVIFMLFRHRAAKHLEVAHEQLKEAYDQLEETTTIKERIESELRIARDIQMSMVPSTFPEIEGLDMYASMTPAREVGGDLYGYIMNDDKLYFCVGDVSGKGIPASLFMAQATRLFQTLANQGMMPAEICTSINDALSGKDNENGMFVTMFIGLLDLQTGHLSFCNAGHNPPIIGGSASHADFLEMEPNAPIGLWPGLQYEGEEIVNVKGRALFIYTDGLNEAEDNNLQQFGDDRLLAILRETDFDNSRQVIETLAAAVERHRNGAEPNDDLTMMCIHVK